MTWREGADVATFAKDAEAFAKGLTALKTITADKDGDITFSDLEAGYYLVTSTLGTKATVGTTPSTPNPVIQEKNEVPTNVKTGEEDSTGKYGSTNDADIGQTVNFKSTITAQPGAENYVFEDTMSAGLTYNNGAKVYTDETMTTELAAANYTVNNNPGDGKTFTITFTRSYLDTITAETKLYVKYSATLNEDAVVGLPGNSNKSTLKYGDSANTKSTPESETITYTWDLDVLKYGNKDKNNVLENAQFVLLNKDKDKVAVVVNGKLAGWTNVPAAGEDGTITWPTNTVLTTNAQGKIKISGLDSDTYYLREIIEIPDLDVSLPIYHGTEESVLQIAVGQLEWSSLPVGGASSHCVLSGHRGLPSAKLFTNLDKLQEGDIFMLRVLDEVLTYEVDKISIVEPSQVSDLEIVEGSDLCTLVTCTPYGINTHCLLVRGHRIDNIQASKAIRITSDALQIEPLLVVPIIATPLLLLLLVLLLLPKRQNPSHGGNEDETM